MTSRKEQQAELLIQFGELVAPLEELVKHPDKQTAQSRAKASAKFTYDRDFFQKSLNEFTGGEPGHNYKVENFQITGNLNRFTNQMVSFRDDTEKLREELHELRNTTIRNILAIPCDLDAEVLEAGSPFSAFIRLRSICETASQQLVFVDPYMGQGVVRRYFNGISEKVAVTVVTKQRNSQEFRDFLDVSKLYADERGPSKYCLKYHPDLHDRYLKCDDYVYHLGGSLKDAGRKSDYTVTKIQADPSANENIVKILRESMEQFGPSNSNHPRP